MHRKWSENLSFRFVQGSDDWRAAFVWDAYQSMVRTSAAAAAAAAAAHRGICRRKFPVAKIHDLYIGIGRSTSQQPNCFQTTGRGVCQRQFAAASDRTTHTENIIYHSGQECATASSLLRRLCQSTVRGFVRSGSDTIYLTVSSEQNAMRRRRVNWSKTIITN